jgi:predicted transcriptional regulator
MTKPLEDVRRMLEHLPEDASYEDIQYHIYARQKIEAGLEAAERGDLLDQEEVEQRLSKWLVE